MLEKLMVYFEYPFVRYALIAAVLIALCSSMAVATVLKLSNNMLLIMPVTIVAAIILLIGGKNIKIKAMPQSL